ncbi:MAG: carbohydrate ABC transporter permease [Chloroflexi bacterium]|nr:carbohydrate ABC transporter permease [Chloroflexota bacterium]
MSTIATTSAPASIIRHATRGIWIKRAVMIVTGLLFAVWTLGPIYWMVATSVKTDLAIYREPSLLPQAPTMANYVQILFRSNFLIYIKNSLIVASATTILAMITGTMAAYAITRLRFAGRRVVARSIVITYLVPGGLLFISLFQVLTDLRLTDRLEGLVLTYLTFSLPFCTWLMVGYFRGLPIELEEAAMVDGCTRLGVLMRITAPLALPAIAVVALYSFTQAWNEFLYALVFISRDSNKPFTVGLIGLVRGDTLPWGPMMAASLMGLIPPVLIYICAQKWVVSGLSAGSVKG